METLRQQYGQPSIPDIQTGLCANILAETKLIANAGYPMQKRDLFMEDCNFTLYYLETCLYKPSLQTKFKDITISPFLSFCPVHLVIRLNIMSTLYLPGQGVSSYQCLGHCTNMKR